MDFPRIEGLFMISTEYKKAVELIRKEAFPIQDAEDLEIAVSVFKLLIKEGYEVHPNEICEYLIVNYGNGREMVDFALKIQQIHEVVKATLKTTSALEEDLLWTEIFGSQSLTNKLKPSLCRVLDQASIA
jgi:hypothetical protein